MAYINKEGYLERKVRSGVKNPHAKATSRDWWTVKSYNVGNNYVGYRIAIQDISFSNKYIGKRVRFKVEFLDSQIDGSEKE